MSAQQDLQDLLRLLTNGRNKITMLAAMGRVKALQGADLKSIQSIANADLEVITAAIKDAKAAKSLSTACKAIVKDPSKKRTAESALASTAKRSKSVYELAPEEQTPQAIEASLALPQPSEDEEAISTSSIHTNRAPLVLAFAVQLLKYTMPEQPLSSRLSLGQAVVNLNSRSKAVSLGIEKGSAEQEGWGSGQPKVRVMGREVHVLKRGGYEWRDDGGSSSEPEIATKTFSMFQPKKKTVNEWNVSASITSKQSTFVARSIEVSSAQEARSELQKLLMNNPELRDASHNISAWRVARDQGGVIEDSNDDGETGGGRHILGVMQSSDVVGVLLVVTRWYGGIMLGTDRWRIMSQVSRDALSQRLRVTGIVGAEALWGLDLDGMKDKNVVTTGTTGGMPVCRPEQAKAYLLRSFNSLPPSEDEAGKKKKTLAMIAKEREDNLGLLLGALDMLFKSWASHISRVELDQRAWGWYIKVRPDVENGIAGWGGKAEVKLSSILDLRRKP